MRNKSKQILFLAVGIIGFAALAPIGQAGEYCAKDGAPKYGPRSVWRLVQQPTSLGISTCAQTTIDQRAAGIKPNRIPYHGVRERHIGHAGYPFAPWSTLGGIPQSVACPDLAGTQVDGLPETQNCPTCEASRTSPARNVVGTTKSPVAPIKVASSNQIIPISSQTSQPIRVESGADGTSDGAPYPIMDQGTPDASQLAPPPPIMSNPNVSTEGISSGGPYSTQAPLTGGSDATYYGGTNGQAVTAMRPGTAQLIVDCPPEMNLMIFRSNNEDGPRNTLRASGTRRIVECTGLDEDGTFGYLLRGEVGRTAFNVEHVVAYDSYPTVPRVFEDRKSTDAGVVWVGVRSGDRVHIRFVEAKPVRTKKKYGPDDSELISQDVLIRPEMKSKCLAVQAPEGQPVLEGPAVAEAAVTDSYAYTWNPVHINRDKDHTHQLYAQIKYDVDTPDAAAPIKEFEFASADLMQRPNRATPRFLVLVATGLTKDARTHDPSTLVAQVKYRTRSDSTTLRDGPTLAPNVPVTLGRLPKAFDSVSCEIDFLNPQKPLVPELQNQLKKFHAMSSDDPVESLELHFALKFSDDQTIPINPPLKIQILP